MDKAGLVQLKRMSNVAHNTSEILQRLVLNNASTWRTDARIALSHVTQLQYDLAKWMSENEIVEQVQTLEGLGIRFRNDEPDSN